MSAHLHYWVHVAAIDWLSRPTIVCRCACGRILSPSQILTLQGVAA